MRFQDGEGIRGGGGGGGGPEDGVVVGEEGEQDAEEEGGRWRRLRLGLRGERWGRRTAEDEEGGEGIGTPGHDDLEVVL